MQVDTQEIEAALKRFEYHARAHRFLAAAGLAKELVAKAGFRSDQPRVPRGEPDGGQWTNGSGQTPRVIQVGSGLFDEEDDDVPWDDVDDLLDVAPTRPDRLSERYRIARGLLTPFKGHPPKRPVSEILEKLQAPEWLREYYPHLDAYMSPAKTLRELQNDARLPMTSGYDDHHNVERAAALRDGLPKKLIDGPENVLRIPRFKHYEVTAEFMRRRLQFDGLSLRDYLRGRSWNERAEHGFRILRALGVLK